MRMTNKTSKDDLINWAETEAKRIRGSLDKLQLEVFTYGLSETSAALEFLRRHAPGSQFARSAEALSLTGAGLTADSAATAVADILDAWARSANESWAEALPFEVQARIDAATDLMEQVQQLLDDSKVHPAAPIVLAGAALEEFLRSRITAKGLSPSGKPGINTYATALQQAGDLTRQEVKNITSWAGLRNHAAHGEWDQISREEARILVAGINLFLQQRMPTP